MKSIWNLSREPGCREAGENLFIFQTHCLGDWKKVVHQGPWTFRGWGVKIEDYDGLLDPEEVKFRGMYIWAQIHGIPELYRKIAVVDDLARRVGKANEVQLSPKLYYEGNYVRIRVLLDVSKPLLRFVSLSVPDEGRKRLMVKYEKIPYFCKRCGLLGHDHEECGDGVWSEKDLQYGSWMLAKRRANQPASEKRGFNRVPFRGSGRHGTGGSDAFSRKRSSAEAALDGHDDMKDTACSPMKTNSEDDEEKAESSVGARRMLVLKDGEEGTENTPNPLEEDLEETPPPPPPYTDPRDRNKHRKVNPENNLALSAASLEEDRWAQ
jgi:hypothetical protein